MESQSTNFTPRGTASQTAHRACRSLHAWASAGGSSRTAARSLGVSTRTIERDLASHLDRHPPHPTPKAFVLSDDLLGLYRDLDNKIRNDRHARKGSGNPLRGFDLQSQVADGLIRVLSWIGNADFVPVTPAELERPGRDVLRRSERALRFYEQSDEPLLGIRRAVLSFGSPSQVPRAMTKAQRNMRITLLYNATFYEHEDVAEAFGLSKRQIGRILKTVGEDNPRVAQWGTELGQMLEACELERCKLQVATEESSKPSLADFKAELDLLNFRARTLAYLGALPCEASYSYANRVEDLLSDARKSCAENKVPDDCQERIELILTEWAKGKKVPPGVRPLTAEERHKRLAEMSIDDDICGR